MLAAYRDTYLDAHEIRIQEVPKPRPGAGDILVRVRATTVNRTDCAVLTGKPYIMRLFTGLTRPRRPIPGTDLAGEVEAVGEAVRAFKPGDRVWGFQDNGWSTQAEYVALPAAGPVRPMPEGIDFSTAVASIEGAHYAINFLNKVDLRADQKVMLNGGTGAIGSAALQLLAFKGVAVTATCRGEDADTVRALGARRTIDYTLEDFTKDEERYEVVFDAVGKSTFGRCQRLLTEKGVYISSELGPRWENPFLALYTPLLGGKRVAFPFPSNIERSLDLMKDLLEGGQFAPLIDRTYALGDIAQAYTYVASGQKKGNVLIDMG